MTAPERIGEAWTTLDAHGWWVAVVRLVSGDEIEVAADLTTQAAAVAAVDRWAAERALEVTWPVVDDFAAPSSTRFRG